MDRRSASGLMERLARLVVEEDLQRRARRLLGRLVSRALAPLHIPSPGEVERLRSQLQHLEEVVRRLERSLERRFEPEAGQDQPDFKGPSLH